jgi:hypothetical protein
MMIYHILASASTGNVIAFAALIAMVLTAGACCGMVAAYAFDKQYDELARELSRLGRRALTQMETARADILRLGDKFDAASAPGSTKSRFGSEANGPSGHASGVKPIQTLKEQRC